MDWGLLTFYRDGRILRRQRVLFPLPTYIFAVVINLLLRFSWTVNRIPGMGQVHSSMIVLLIELGEVIRRSIWILYRVEWEVIVQQEKAIGKDPVLAEKLRLKYPVLNNSQS